MRDLNSKLVQTSILFALLLLAPWVNFLRFNDYGYFHLEAIIIGAILILLAVSYAFLYCFSNWAFKIIFLAGLITLVFSFFSSTQTIALLLLIFVLAVAICIIFAEKIIDILIVFSSIFVLGIIFLPVKKNLSTPQAVTQSIAKTNNKLPLIVYLILDEHAGISALASANAQGQVLAQQLRNFYGQYGFQLYGDAYSHYPATYNSIPNFLNFTAVAQDDFYFTDPNNRILKQNTLFKILAAEGYQFRVYQSDYLDYCQPQGITVSYCYTYPARSIKVVQTTNLSDWNKVELLTKCFLLQSSAYQFIMRQYENYLQPWLVAQGWPAPEWGWNQARVSSLIIPTVFAQLKQDIVKHPVGTVFFAHLLAPHNPYIYDANCNLLTPPSKWLIGRGLAPTPTSQMLLGGGLIPMVNTTTSRNQRYLTYEGQVACVQKRVQDLFAVMQAAGIYNKAIIIVQGDHGSRIGLHIPWDEAYTHLTQQDFSDYYVTLFAAKIPGQPASYNNQLVDVQNLLAHVVETITGKSVKVEQPKVPYVYLFPLQVGASLQAVNVANFK